MFKITFCLFLFSFFGFGQNIQFSDPNLHTYLTTKLCVDTNGNGVYNSTADFNNDGQIQLSEAQLILRLAFRNTASNIQNLGGIENFINLEHLEVTAINVGLLDLSIIPSLESVKLSSTSTHSYIFNNPLLTHFELQNTAFSNPVFNLTNLPSLEYVRIQSFHLTDNLIFGTHNNLQELRILAGNYSTLNLSGMPALKYLNISKFTGTSLDISNCTLLEEFVFRYKNNLISIIGSDASSFLKIIDFSQDNYINTPSNLDLVFNNQSLIDVTVYGAKSVSISNNITDIGIVELWFINESVNINNSSFSYIDSLLSARIKLSYINSSQLSFTNIEGLRLLTFQNLITNSLLDLSTVEVESFSLANCSLTEINLKNGYAIQNFNSDYTTDIQFICVDRDEFNIVENGYANSDSPVVIHPYCSFVLGGDYYEITGELLLDLGNGCLPITYGPIFDMQFTVTDGFNTDTFYPNNTNNYSFTLPEGNHVLSNQLIDLNYWTVSPSSLDFNFPTDASPSVQDFCITPTGTFNDAEIFIVPLNSVQPGFQADYKLIYKNKGTTSLSGNVNIVYNDDLMDFSTALPNTNNQSTGSLTWNFVDLMPFEMREISFSMLLNTPTHPNFPLNGDDILNYTATVNPLTVVDVTPNDNTFILHQTLVNSFDPNDIRCLEGNSITPEKIGEYVHYIIRFENNGTANATNVVIKDVLDTSKFDLNSLVPLHASHDFYTRIVNDNEVEFVFENIQLPFDDANNDGYVLFKIKTLPSLVLGDSFSNQASIYFDFNFPIVTNNETTVVEESLSIADLIIEQVSIFPNPTNSFLNVETKINISSIAIYDLKGRLLKRTQPGSSNNGYRLDVTSLSNGVYLLEVQSGNSKQNLKFVKN